MYGRTSVRQVLFTLNILRAPANRAGIRRELNQAAKVRHYTAFSIMQR